jgi:hypothetical protein
MMARKLRHVAKQQCILYIYKYSLLEDYRLIVATSFSSPNDQDNYAGGRVSSWSTHAWQIKV